MTTKWTLNKERSAVVPVYSDQYADNRSDECNYEGRIVYLCIFPESSCGQLVN